MESRYQDRSPDKGKVLRLGSQVDTRYQHWDTKWIQGTRTGTPGEYKVRGIVHQVNQGSRKGHQAYTKYKDRNTRQIQDARTGTQDKYKVLGLGH